ncbi:nucleoside recognition membrane protein YjiH [Clostridium algifaecis]|uniref:Nucleoside recognition membrane protein YjiH n=1 Tax=Clostridium algifaecis TaxID=1472040 RepID=A0ABS4KN88_9CLOT|nr:hypothetical protein [Clostridium algifaecis]MBP2031503.1 nucleoside recognition membrane protein YjiH [Clostridium algifaecis]
MKTIFELIIIGIVLFSVIIKSKRIFKLRSELVFFAIISIIISFILVVFLKEFVLGSFLNNYEDTPKYVHENMITRIEYELKNMNINDPNKLQKYMDKEFNMSYSIFVVKKDGKVTFSNNKEIKSIDAQEIIDGKKHLNF